jgi:hypothetical protein
MHHRSQETSIRTLVWVEGLSVGWGCSECAWVFEFSGPPIGRSLDEITRKFQVQLSQEFAAHDCAEFPRAKVKPS